MAVHAHTYPWWIRMHDDRSVVHSNLEANELKEVTCCAQDRHALSQGLASKCLKRCLSCLRDSIQSTLAFYTARCFSARDLLLLHDQ